MKHYLSFGGGVNSVALYLLMEQLGMDFEAITVDHGADWPETYEYTEMFIKSGRPITVIDPGGLYDHCWDKKIVPSMRFRWCTDKFKIRPVQKYIDKPCFMHLGIDAGESKRAKLSSTKGIENRYLLIEHDITRDDCKDIIKKTGLPVPMKSGCYFCPYQRVGQWKKLRKEHPDLFCKAEKLEKRSGRTIRPNGKQLRTIVNNIDKQKALPGLEEMEYPPCQCQL